MPNTFDLNQLSAEASARLRLRQRINWAMYALFALNFAALLLVSVQGEPSQAVMALVIVLFPMLFIFQLVFMRSSIGWGLMLHIFRPSGRELLRDFPPARINWYPLLLGAATFIAAIGLTFGAIWNIVVVAVVAIGCGFVQMQATSALQRGDYATVERYAAFAERWLLYPNLFGYRLVALVNARRFNDALTISAERLAHTPRLAPCLSEALHAQALTLLIAKRYDEVLPPAELALRLSPETASLYLTLADWQLNYAENPARALEVLDAAKPVLSSFEYNWRLYRARTYAHLGLFDEAETELATAEKMSIVQYPQITTKTSLLFATVDVKTRAGDMQAAREAYDMLVTLDTDGGQARGAREMLDKFM